MDSKQYDVIVAGGGPAGIAAATASARSGAKTLLVEQQGFLGGVSASGLPFLDFFNHNGTQVIKGIAEELVARLLKEKASLGHLVNTGGHVSSITMLDPEWVKIISEEMVLDAGAAILYHSFVCGTDVGENRLKALQIANKGGLQRYEAEVFIDTTGDGDLAAFAGARYEKGRPQDGMLQAMSLVFKLIGVDVETVTDIFDKSRVLAQPIGGDHVYNIHATGKYERWADLLQDNRIFKAGGNHDFWAGTMYENELTYVNTVRVTGLDPTDPAELSAAEIEGRKQLKQIFGFLKQYVPGMADIRLGSIPAQIGIRETRRILGEYVLTGDDVLQGRKFADAIAKNGYCIDIHDPQGKKWNARFIESEDKTYDIPYRCLVPERLDGLLVAGRCISTTHDSLGSTRIMPCCMALGQAAGTAAALACRQGVAPRAVDVQKLRENLADAGAVV